MDRTVLIILGLLGLVAACANAAEQHPHMFASLSSSKPVGWSDEYEHAASRASFRGLRVKNCDLMGPILANTLYFELDMSCLNSDHDESELVALSQSVGTCSVSVDFFASPFISRSVLSGLFGNILDNITEVTQIARYNFQCGFKNGANDCGLECGDDGVVLESEGPVYAIPNVAIPGTGPLVGIPGEYECLTRSIGLFEAQAQRVVEYFLGGGQLPKTKPNKPANHLGGSRLHQPLPKSQPKKGAKPQQYGEDATLTYTKGGAVIATGPFRLLGKHTSLKYDEGFMQAVLYTKLDEGSPSIVPTSTTPIIEPYSMDLKLKKHDGYKY